MAGKRVIVFTNHFYPENFRINDVAFFLAKENYQITVLTCIPNYPTGKYFKGYGIFQKRKEVIAGVTVIRIPMISRGNGKAFRLFLNYFSYAFFLSIKTFFLSFGEKYEFVLVHHTSPIFLGVPAVLLKKRQKAKLIFWNLDLWPESVQAASKVTNQLVYRILNKMVNFIYLNSDHFLISSKGFVHSMMDKGADTNKITYFPNWAEDVYISNIENSSSALPLKGRTNFFFKVMYAGNIGESQDVENIFNTIKEVYVSNKKIKWTLVGDGRKKDWLKKEVERNSLSQNVEFLGNLPVEQLPELIKSADAMLVTLKNSYIFSITIPAKIQAYMASQKPILGMLDGAGADIINDAQCGATCPSGDHKSLTFNVLKLSNMKTDQLQEIGRNGFNYYEENFSKEVTFEKLLNLLKA
ncbi:MAG: glycosyltransferase family 4 protein [Ignavibacteriaceae bacterium]|jgi:glycosyltransferase involved in cell wall biosynthesis|nr:glycosyltransferase family 4 protein [Ignavibacteriaceae bacterium]